MRRWQNRMAESTATLPTMCVVATLLWWLPQGSYSTDYLFGWMSSALTTYLIMEMAAQNALLRIRSRMVSSLYLLIMAMCGFLHPLQIGTIAMLCLAFSFYSLLRTCDQLRPEVNTMHAYLAISLGSLLWAPLLLLTPVLWWSQGIYLRSLTQRSFGASLIGLLLPYALWATVAFTLGNLMPFIDHAKVIIAPFTEPFYWQWVVNYVRSADESLSFSELLEQHFTALWQAHPAEVVALSVTLLIGFTGFVHYVTNSYDDKIRVRMCHYTMMAIQVILFVWLMLQPQHFPELFPLIIVASAPAAAHFISLTHSWLSNAWVILLFLLLIAVGIYCLALPHVRLP